MKRVRLPVWVKRVGLTIRRSLPFFPYEQTSSDRADWSVSCHKRTPPAVRGSITSLPRPKRQWLRKFRRRGGHQVYVDQRLLALEQATSIYIQQTTRFMGAATARWP